MCCSTAGVHRAPGRIRRIGEEQPIRQEKETRNGAGDGQERLAHALVEASPTWKRTPGSPAAAA